MFQNLHSLIEAKLAERIKQGLVRVLDIVEDRRVYGGISDKDRSTIKAVYRHGLQEGIESSDLVLTIESLVQEVTIPPIGSTAPGVPTPPKPPGTAPMTARAPGEPEPAANVQIGQQPQSQQQPINPQNLEKEIGDRLKDPTFGKDFAELLARVMQRK